MKLVLTMRSTSRSVVEEIAPMWMTMSIADRWAAR
jgi:hypothetical protein